MNTSRREELFQLFPDDNEHNADIQILPPTMENYGAARGPNMLQTSSLISHNPNNNGAVPNINISIPD
jgi:hypothetical protein